MRTRDNPFSTRYIQPGAIPYQFFGTESADQLVKRFQTELNGRGAIIGPHGSGKSTLLESLVPQLGMLVRYVDFATGATEVQHRPGSALCTKQLKNEPNQLSAQTGNLDRSTNDEDKEGQTPIHWLRLSASTASATSMIREALSPPQGALLVIDGFEQLPSFIRKWLAWRSWWRSEKLLITSHSAPLGIPVLYRAFIQKQSAEYAVRYLLKDQPELADRILSSDRFRKLQRKWGNNLRELLFELYDMYEDGNRFD